MQPEKLPEPEEQLRRPSPASYLSEEQWEATRGNLLAVLLDGPNRGKLIAFAPLDFDHPEIPRRSLEKQVQDSIYKDCRYIIYQNLKEDPEGPIAADGSF